MVTENQKTSTQWTWEQNKAFEKALVSFINDNNLEKLASEVPGKTIEDVCCHLNDLLKDIGSIESGLVPIPHYISSSFPFASSSSSSSSSSSDGANTSKPKRERRKGTLWSKKEHMLFLYGLLVYGKGDWRSISRNCVVTRTPTQVASHAQKYFIRLNSMKKDRRRSSIHDITHVDGGDMFGYQGLILSQTSTDDVPFAWVASTPHLSLM
ncbi:putative transcription factor MYB-HB-like family [Dioscorea sansibarensis]